MKPPASTKQLHCLNIRKFISMALSEGLQFIKGKKDVHAFDVAFFAIGARRIGTCSRNYKVLKITTNTEKSIRSVLGIVTNYNPIPPSHPTCPASGELLTGWLGLTSRSSRVRSGSVSSVNTDCSRVGDTSRGHCWEGREKSQLVATIDLLLILNSGQQNVKRVRCKPMCHQLGKKGWHDWSGSGPAEISHVETIFRVIYLLCSCSVCWSSIWLLPNNMLRSCLSDLPSDWLIIQLRFRYIIWRILM